MRAPATTPRSGRAGALLALGASCAAAAVLVLAFGLDRPSATGAPPRQPDRSGDAPADGRAADLPLDEGRLAPIAGAARGGGGRAISERASAPGRAGASITFHVIGDGVGAPLEGATVTPMVGRTPTNGDAARSDRDGRVELAPGPAEYHEIAADGHVPVYAADLARLDGGLLRLHRSATLVVRVPGRPRGIAAVVRGTAPDSFFDRELIREGLASNPAGDGIARFEGLVAGFYSVQATDWPDLLGEATLFELLPGETRAVTLEPGPSATLIGEVVEIGPARPMAGVRVRREPPVWSAIELIPGAGTHRAAPVRTTDEAGRFEFRGVPLGPTELQLELPDGSEVVREVVVREGQEARVVRLRARAPGELAGRLSEDLASEAGEWRVTAFPRGQVPPYASSGPIDGLLSVFGPVADVGADGGFTIHSAASSRPLVVLAVGRRSDGSTSLGLHEVAEPLSAGEQRDGIVVEKAPGRPFTLAVSDTSGAPVREVRVEVEERLGASTTTRRETLSSADGRFGLATQVSEVARLRVRSDAHRSTDASLGADVDEVAVTLAPQRRISFVVRDERGVGVASARVRAVATGDGEDALAGRRELGGRADRAGRSSLDLDPVCEWRVSPEAPGHEPVGEPALIAPGHRPSDVVELELRRSAEEAPAAITGRIVRAGRGKPVYDVTFRGIGGARAVVDGAEFEIRGLAPGPVDIVVDCGGYELIPMPVDSLLPGEVRDVGELLARGATDVEVRITDEAGDGLPAARGWLERRRPGSGGGADLPERVELSGDGAIHTAERVGRGAWRLRVTHPGKAPYRRDIVLEGRIERLHVTMKDT